MTASQMDQTHSKDSSNILSPQPPADPVAATAAGWLARQHAGLDAAEKAELAAWLAADARHAAAWARLAAYWSAAAALPRPATARRPVRRGWQIAAAVACLCIAVLAGWLLAEPGRFADLQSATGERRAAVLADGSRIELSTDSAVDVAFDATMRRVRLLRGEAFFEVTRDPAGRPFVVEANGGSVTALGTAFAVAREDDGGVRVVVTEHAVAVRPDAGQAEDVQTVAAGQMLEWRRGGAVTAPPQPCDAAVLLGWREGQLVFDSRPLADVMAELDRWRPGRTVILGHDLARRPVSMAVDIRRLAGVDAALAAALPVTLRHLSPWLTVIRPAE